MNIIIGIIIGFFTALMVAMAALWLVGTCAALDIFKR
jgi:hypothetical protein